MHTKRHLFVFITFLLVIFTSFSIALAGGVSLKSASACSNTNSVSATAYVNVEDGELWFFGIFDVADTINTVSALLMGGGPMIDPLDALTITGAFDYGFEAFSGSINLSSPLHLQPGQDVFVATYSDAAGLYVTTITGKNCGVDDSAAQRWRETTCGISVTAVGGPAKYEDMWLVGGLLVRSGGSEVEEIGYWRDDEYVTLGFREETFVVAAENKLVTDEMLEMLIAMCGWD